MIIKIVYYRCLDHFTSNDINEKECIQEGIGIFVGENKEYLLLKTLDADINNPNSEKEYNNIIKNTIIYRKDIDVEINS